MEDKKIQIVEMLRNIYSITDEESLKIYNEVIKWKTEEEINDIFNELVDILEYKNTLLKKLSIDLSKEVNFLEEKKEKEQEKIDINFNI